jgi:hypothetical protein
MSVPVMDIMQVPMRVPQHLVAMFVRMRLPLEVL